MMELDISEFFRAADPAAYSASVAELGQNAGAITWQAAKEADFRILDSKEKRHAFRLFVLDSGGWSRAEIAAWSHEELNALCIQWISGDMREAGLTGTDSDDWEEYEKQSEAGQCAGRIFRADDGRVYFYCGV
jgi:hypothetical protein